MDTKLEAAIVSKDREGERGAALVTVLMISFLLLVGVTALLLESSMNTANVTDATSEEQAYYAAESGIQSVVDALRHNPMPSPLINASASPLPPDPDADPENLITYSKAVRLDTSNATCTKSGSTITCTSPDDNEPRLSRWLRYSTAFPDRVILGDEATYTERDGFAYRVTVRDPDNTGGVVSYSMTGQIEDGSGGWAPSRTFGSGGDTTTVEYTPPVGTQTVDVTSGSGNGNLGTFRVTNQGAGGVPPTGNSLTRFKLVMAVTQPQNAHITIRGYILPAGGMIGDPSPGSQCDRAGKISYLFDSQAYIAFGSRTSLNNTGCLVEETSTQSGPHQTYLTGWMIGSDASGVDTPLTANITEPEPTRLLIRSTGFGPRGARKELETVIQKNYFNGLGAPSPLTLIGPPCTLVIGLGNCVSKPIPEGDFTFDPGNSNPIFYSGKDKQLKVFLPPIGLTNDPNLNEVNTVVEGFNGKVFGTVENVANELPFWLQNPRNLDQTVQLLKAAAQASGTYWGPTSNPPTSDVYGDWATATGITFVDRDVTISQDGGGILVVTGQLNFKGNFRFNGLVLITGPKTASSDGGFLRNGGGTGVLAGNMIVAPYDNWSLNTCMSNVFVTNKLDCFHSPWYKISGGGTSDLMFNSQNVTNGLSGVGNFVKGVAEK